MEPQLSVACPLSYRSRRSGLIPNNVSLTPQEENVIADRIGYRPRPPPGTIESNWFASVPDTNWAPKPFESQSENNCQNFSGERGAENPLSDDEQSNPTPSPSQKTNGLSRSAQRDDEIQRPNDTTSPTNTPSRYYLQLPWSVDIPHMSEIPPVNSMPSKNSAATRHAEALTSGTMNSTPSGNSKLDRAVPGELPARDTSLIARPPA